MHAMHGGLVLAAGLAAASLSHVPARSEAAADTSQQGTGG